MTGLEVLTKCPRAYIKSILAKKHTVKRTVKTTSTSASSKKYKFVLTGGLDSRNYFLDNRPFKNP